MFGNLGVYFYIEFNIIYKDVDGGCFIIKVGLILKDKKYNIK